MSGILRSTFKIYLAVSSVNYTVSCCNVPLFHRLTKMPFYAVAKGRIPGIYNSWADCETQVKGFSGAKFKKFDTASGATDFINGNSNGTYGNTTRPTNSFKGSSSNNLKRSYSTSSKTKTSRSLKKKDSEKSGDSETNTDFSDDGLDDIITKQMDDIEKRLTSFSKGIDKITKGASKTSHTIAKKTILIDPPQVKRSKYNDTNDFEVDDEGFVQVYTDGACSANGTKGASAGLGVYWGHQHRFNRSEPVSGRATNNCGEIQAATLAIKTALENGVKKLTIHTDSQFLINSATKWIPGWKRKGWKLASGEPVKNEIDFRELDSVQNKLEIKWNYVKAHNGLYGNEMADKLAKAGAALYKLL